MLLLLFFLADLLFCSCLILSILDQREKATVDGDHLAEAKRSKRKLAYDMTIETWNRYEAPVRRTGQHSCSGDQNDCVA